MRALRTALAALTLLPAAGIAADEHAHWSYHGSDGPTVWGTLSPEYAECGRGTRQSPIDLPVAVGVEAPSEAPAALRAAHHEHVIDVINDGHTVKVVYDDGDDLMLGDKTYSLVQYHFHAPSEHTVGGAHFPLELHLVHRAQDGALAVLAVLLEKGPHNDNFDPVLTHLPQVTGGAEHVEHVAIDVDQMLPHTRSVFSYTGSLTTPPCTEGVRWLVMRVPVSLDAGQINRLADLLHDNARPVQPLGERRVSASSLNDGSP